MSSSSLMAPRVAAVAALIVAASACVNDPAYIQPADPVEVAIPGSDIDIATTSLLLPVRTETDMEAADRAAVAEQLGVDVPFVRLEDIDMQLEWTLKNLSDAEASARIHVNAANEWFAFVPLAFVIDPEEDPEPPPLMGDTPVQVPALGTITGTFREDQLREAAIDLELITRGATNPIAAVLNIHEEMKEFSNVEGTTVPLNAFAHIIRLDIELRSAQHMVLEFALRVRSDDRTLLHDELLTAPTAELTTFAPADFVPPPPEE